MSTQPHNNCPTDSETTAGAITRTPVITPKPIRSFGVADLLIFIILLAGVFTAFPLMKSNMPDSLAVFRENSLIAEYPLESDLVFFINGRNGPVEIEIKNREVSIRTVTCPHQICKRSGSIRRPFEQLVCAPNHILLEIRSSGSAKRIDAITY